MPLRAPKKDESQKDYMAYCMHELGQADTERPQEQMVAICLRSFRQGKQAQKKSEVIVNEGMEWFFFMDEHGIIQLQSSVEDSDFEEQVTVGEKFFGVPYNEMRAAETGAVVVDELGNGRIKETES